MDKKQIITGRNFGRWLSLCLIIAFMTCLMLVQTDRSAIAQECTELADVPLELKSRAAPGLISLVVDNSRTMYYTIMTSGGNGMYNVNGTDYAILFPDHTYSANFLPPEYRNHWKTQWAGFNTMYYNPDVNYKPWPRWHQLKDDKGDFIADNPPADGNAVFENSRYHPLSDGETIDLGETFYAYGGGAIGSSIYVDNSDPGFQIDTGTWTDLTAGLIYWPDPNGTLTSHYTGAHPAKASWTAGGLDWKTSYDVWVYIPHYATSEFPDQKEATYRVFGSKGEEAVVTRFQPDYPGWTLLTTPVKPDKATGEIIITIESVGLVAGKVIDADAVCVAPVDSFDPTVAPPAGSINIIYGHYFVQNANGTYLVNMDGALAYYEFNDTNGDDVVDFGELVKLTDGEAETAGIKRPSYDAERQNFANWHQFYRKRMYAGVGAVGQFINDLSGVFFRLYGFPSSGFKDQMRSLNVNLPGIADETDIVLANFYELKPPQANPNETVHAALHDVGGLIEDGNSLGAGKNTDFGVDVDGEYYSSAATYPYFTEKHGGHCQQAFAIVMSGGYWVVKNNSETLADVALSYYDHDLRSDDILSNFVPKAPNNLDNATYQHLVTYGLSFGVQGTLNPDDYPECVYGGTCPNPWPAPITEHPTTIDDLWHATVNGHGLFINASNPEELVAALKAIRSDIERRLGSAAAVSTNSVQRRTGTHLYQGRYDSNFWSGDLQAFSIDVFDGSVDEEALWKAKDVLDDDSITDWSLRNIFTFNGTAGVSFDYTNLTPAQKALLDPADPVRAENIVDYLKGKRTLELKDGGPFRTRASRLGDIVHSEPVYHENAVYAGANDGMVHAFAAGDDSFTGFVGGQELFAYIPNMVYGHLAKIAEPTYDHLYYVNGTPYAKNIGGTSLLVGGLGKGGKGYYCLDITNPANFGASNIKWEYSAVAESDADLGYSFSRPFIVNTKAAGWVVIFGNGYNSDSGEAVLYIVDIDDSTGALVDVTKIKTGVSGCNGIVAPPAIIDPNVDGLADYVYVGDLKGNMWKFDISGANKTDWGVAFGTTAVPQPLFTAKNAAGDAQRITAMADIMRHCDIDKHGYIVIFGTGQYVNEADFDTTNVQTLYGIWDTQPAWEYMVDNGLVADPKESYLGEFNQDRTLSNTVWSGFTLLEQSGGFETHNGKTYFFMSDNPIVYWDYSDPANFTGDHVGWYFDLPGSAERVIRDPVIRAGIALFMGTTPVQTPCSSGGSTTIYQIDACSGGAPEKPQFDTDGNDKVNSDDTIDGRNPAGISIDEMLYKPVDIKDKLYISDDSADILAVPVPPALGGMLYWRETDIRR